MSAELILVDDDKVLHRVLEKMLRIVNPSLQLSSFSAGKAALDHLLKRPPSGTKTCLLLDINLPDMSAWELLDRLESDLASCPPTVLITSSLGASNSEKTKDYPQIVGFFEKPITFENIRQIFHLVGKH